MIWVLRQSVEFSVNSRDPIASLNFRIEAFERRAPADNDSRIRLRVWRYEQFTVKPTFGSQSAAEHTFLVSDYLFDNVEIRSQSVENAIEEGIDRIVQQCGVALE